jgi:Dam-replacing HTH domain
MTLPTRTWKSELTDFVQQHVIVGERFTLDSYLFEEHFRPLYPSNKTPRNQLRYTMQALRREGVVTFVDDDGTYERLA